MKNLSLKLDEQVFEETEKILAEININRNRYINQQYNSSISFKRGK